MLLYFNSTCYTCPATVVPDLPTKDADFISGNVLVGGRLEANPLPILSLNLEDYTDTLDLKASMPKLFQQCAVIRAAAEKEKKRQDTTNSAPAEGDHLSQGDPNLINLFFSTEPVRPITTTDKVSVGRETLTAAQRRDDELQNLFSQAEAQTNDPWPTTKYFLQTGVLCRR